MAASSFAATIGEWAKDVEGAFEAIVKESAQEVVADMQRVGPSIASTQAAIAKGIGSAGRGKKKTQAQGPVQALGDGGRMPVDTGFLRASLMASTAAMPPIQSGKVPAEGKAYTFSDTQVTAVVAGSDLGQTIYFGYTAAYAAAMEYGANGGPAYAFVRTAAQRWPAIVDAKAAELKSRLGL